MTERRGILFDKDGTLIDFNATWLPLYTRGADLIEANLEQPGLSLRLLNAGGYDTQNQRWISNSVLASGSNKDIMNFWEKESGQTLDTALKDQITEIFTAEKDTPVAIIDDLRTLLEYLTSLGYQLGVATMDDEASARASLSALNILHTMDFVCGADSGFGVKPDAGMIRAFCDHCDLLPSAVIMVGDSPRDLQMVTNLDAGLAIGVLSGASAQQDLAEHADVILNDISELPATLQDLRHKNQ